MNEISEQSKATDRSVSIESDNDSMPWQGESTVLYPPDEVREANRQRINDGLRRHAGALGVLASELAEEVAKEIFEETGEVIITTGDVTLEISRMLGTSIRMAPNNRLYPKQM